MTEIPKIILKITNIPLKRKYGYYSYGLESDMQRYEGVAGGGGYKATRLHVANGV